MRKIASEKNYRILKQAQQPRCVQDVFDPEAAINEWYQAGEPQEGSGKWTSITAKAELEKICLKEVELEEDGTGYMIDIWGESHDVSRDMIHDDEW